MQATRLTCFRLKRRNGGSQQEQVDNRDASCCSPGTQCHAPRTVDRRDCWRLRPQSDVEKEPKVLAVDPDARQLPHNPPAARRNEVEERQWHRPHAWVLHPESRKLQRGDLGAGNIAITAIAAGCASKPVTAGARRLVFPWHVCLCWDPPSVPHKTPPPRTTGLQDGCTRGGSLCPDECP